MADMAITYVKEGDRHVLGMDGAPFGDLVVDYTGVPVEGRAGTAKQLLAASALFCYCSQLVGALDARGARYTDIRGKATIKMGPNDLGQGRVKEITIEVAVTLPQEDGEVFERCAKIMKNGCLVTGSLHEGVGMKYNLTAEYKD